MSSPPQTFDQLMESIDSSISRSYAKIVFCGIIVLIIFAFFSWNAMQIVKTIADHKKTTKGNTKPYEDPAGDSWDPVLIEDQIPESDAALFSKALRQREASLLGYRDTAKQICEQRVGTKCVPDQTLTSSFVKVKDANNS